MFRKIDQNISVFESNYYAAKHAFILNSGLEASACAAAFIGRDEPVSIEALKNAKKIINSNTGIFSTLGRGNARQVLAATLCMSEDPRTAMDTIKRIHKGLDKKFFNSDYLVLAATVIFKNVHPSEYNLVIDRTRKIYKLQRVEHPLLTNREDIVNCVLMATGNDTPEVISQRAEDNFQALKKYYFLKNKIQFLSCVMSLSDGKPEENAAKISRTHQALKRAGVRISSEAFSLIAAIALLARDEDLEAIATNIADVSNRLRKNRGLGALGAGKRIRNLLASAIVMDAYSRDNTGRIKESAISAIMTAIIAAEIAAIVAASAAASSAAASSS